MVQKVLMYPNLHIQVSYILRRYMENTKSDTRCNIQVNSVSIVNFFLLFNFRFHYCPSQVEVGDWRTMDHSKGLDRKGKGWWG